MAAATAAATVVVVVAAAAVVAVVLENTEKRCDLFLFLKTSKIGRRNPRLKCNALPDLKVTQRSSGVNQSSNCSEMSYGYPVLQDD